MTKEEFSAHLAAQEYDKYYQAIKPIGFAGYSKSEKTWNRIRGLIDWKDLSVVDLGCFHGYFCFRAKEAGASKVDGLDLAEVVLVSARKIGELEGIDVTFSQWDDSQDIPQCDVTLCLNALHHFKDPLGCLGRIQSDRAIFEIQQSQKPIISSVFDIEIEAGSHRDQRVILLARKKS